MSMRDPAAPVPLSGPYAELRKRLQVRIDRANDRLEEAGYSRAYRLQESVTTVDNRDGRIAGLPHRLVPSVHGVVVVDAPTTGRHTVLARHERVNTDRGKDRFMTRNFEGANVANPDTPDCDECGHKRDRSTLYTILDNATGETAQAGSTCVEKFTGAAFPHLDEPRFIMYEELEKFAPTSSEYDYDVREVVAAGIAAVRQDGGWKTGGTGRVAKLLVEKDSPKVTDSDRAEADGIIGAIADSEDSSEYAQNLKTAVEAGYVNTQHIGLVASAIVWRTNNVKPESVKLGEPGQTVKVGRSIIESHTTYVNDYDSVVHVITGYTSDGQRWKTHTASKHFRELSPGDAIEFTGVVKSQAKTHRGWVTNLTPKVTRKTPLKVIT